MRRPGDAGFTYLGLLVLFLILTAGTAATGVLRSVTSKRLKGEELLWVGEQYAKAIKSYRERAPGTSKPYPRTLEALLRDDRHAGIVRHLRRLYPDPITGRMDWELIRAPEVGISGLHCSVKDVPFKQSNFPQRLKDLEGKQSYADWVFGERPLGAKSSGDAANATPAAGTPDASTETRAAPSVRRQDRNR